ncbi:MAG: non-ribosomal peptide synthetase [Ktedonobacteraceae bacterium]
MNKDRPYSLSVEKQRLLSLLLKERHLDASQESAILPRPTIKDTAPPLSFAQEQLWFFEQLIPGSAVYNVPAALRFVGSLHIEALEKSVNETVQRHEALRTTITRREGYPVNIILPSLSIPLPIVDLSGIFQSDEGKDEEDIQHLVLQEVQKPFDFARGPLLRTLLLRLNEKTHLFLVTVQHIVSDGWSLDIFLREVSILYTAFITGSQASLPPLPIQYADYASWQRKQFSEGVLDGELSYWKQRLVDAPLILDLPMQNSYRAAPNFQGAVQSLALPRSLERALRRLSLEENITLYMLLLTAFQVLLYRYTGQEDLIIGTPIANRSRPETANLIGLFVNTLVLRSRLSHQARFRNVLQETRLMFLDAYAHQELAFEKLVETLRPQRDPRYNPLFQVLFAFQHASSTSLAFAELNCEQLDVVKETTMFDLSLHIRETVSGLTASAVYSTDIFESTWIRQMLDHFLVLLEDIVANPERRLGDLALLTEAEQHQFLKKWNSVGMTYPVKLCVHQLFEEQATRRPDAVALVYEGEQITYAELNKQANRLAGHLRELEVAPEVAVGIMLPPSLAMIIGLLGILKTGGIYVPLDPTLPQERLSFLLIDAQIAVLLTNGSQGPNMPMYRGEMIDLEGLQQKEESVYDTNPPDNESVVDNAAYLIYTSGSTGKAKGVVVTHANIFRLFAATQTCFHFRETDVWSLFHSYAFDFSVWEIWGALTSGGRLVVIPYWVSRSPQAFYRVLSSEGITILSQTPTAFQQLVDAERQLQRPPLFVRLIILGGEALSFQRLNIWYARHQDNHPQLINMYGITETTVHVTYRPLTLRDVQGTRDSFIGKALSDLQIYILDSHMSLLPVGVPGEIYIGGGGLARGYFNHPELTAERFLPDPFSIKPGVRLYRTGDRACYVSSGDIAYLGRLDHQVKLRGYRIEIGEIESILLEYPLVQNVVVVLREDVPGEKRLVAYLVMTESALTNQPDALDQLRSFLRAKLPEYMLPSSFVMLAALPTLPSGKIARRALPEPEEDQQEENRLLSPQTGTEQVLIRIWQEVLQREHVGVHDNFFDLGGHSLLIVKLQSRVQEILQRDLAVTTFFQYPTIHVLAQALDHGEDLSALPSPSLTNTRTERIKTQRRSRLEQRKSQGKSNL